MRHSNSVVKCLFNLFLIARLCVVNGQPLLKFEHYTSDNGLSNRNTAALLVDHSGFLWISTINGVNRYDGYEFKIFRNDPYDSSTLSRGWAGAMAEDHKGDIWIACAIPQGLNRYDPMSGNFFRYSDDEQYKKILPTSIINFIYVDSKNNLWLSTDGDGLIRFNPERNQSVKYVHSNADTNSISDNSMLGIVQLDSTHLCIGSPYGFDILNSENGKFSHYRLHDYTSHSPVDAFFNSLLKDHTGKLWIATTTGLKMFDPNSHQIISFHHDATDPFSLSTDSLNSLCETPDGQLWITTMSQGIEVFDPKTKKFFHYRHDEKDPNSISSNATFQIAYHPSGKIFIKDDFGIDAVNLRPQRFRLFRHEEGNSTSVSSNSVGQSFCDSHKNVFVCSAQGLNVFDEKWGTFHLYQPDAKVNSIFRSSAIYMITEDREGNLWVVADQKKVVMYNPQTHYARIFQIIPGNKDSLSVGYIWAVFEDSKGNYWFNGASHSCSYNPSTKKFSKHLIDPTKPELDLNGIGMITEWDGKIWGNSLTGLIYYDEAHDTFIHPSFKGHPAAETLQQNWTICFFIEQKNKLWVGTMGQGLFYIDTENGKCVSISTRDGLPDDNVWSIIKDDHNNLWLATNRGLCRFTPSKELLELKAEKIADKGTFRNYNTADGLPAEEMSNDLPAKTSDGHLLFAFQSNEGMMLFHPDSLPDNKFIPPVYITGFSLFNKEIVPSDTNKFLKHTIETTKEIILTYRENVFSFSFAALNLVHPESNRYAYMLEPFDKNWNYTDASKRFANYTNIDPGTYTFKVKASNNDGVWNETPAEIKLIITPPFWKSIWFRILVGATLAFALYGTYRFRLYQIISLQNIRNKIAGDLHDEIGSTLNSISIFSEVAKKKSQEEIPELKMIGEASRRVIDAMSDIVWTINPENDSFEKIIFRMRSLTHSLMKAKKIEYSFRADETLNELKLPMMTRKNFYLIFKEALNNLVKYSNATRASVSLAQSGQQIELLIRDNGVGFDMNNAEKGNGLNNMNRRATEMKARIEIQSRVNEGTSVQLLLSKKSKT